MKTKTYVIQDWAGNLLKGRIKSGLRLALEFKSFEAGWDYIYQNVPDEDHAYDDLYVLEKGGE